METTNIVSDHSKKSAGRLRIVQDDLLKEFDKFPSKTIAYKALSERMGLSERTIRRILKGTHTPNYQTLIKVYRYILGTTNDRETFLNMPLSIKEAIEEGYDNFSLTSDEVNFLPEIDFYLSSDSVFRSIYLETAAGNIHRDKVGYEHGQHGLKVLDKMVKLGVIQQLKPDIYGASLNRAQLSPESSFELCKHLVENKFNVEKTHLSGENFYQVLIEGIDVDTYNEFLKLEWETKNKRLELLKKSKKGKIKFWFASFIDTLSSKLIYDDHATDVENKGVIQ